MDLDVLLKEYNTSYYEQISKPIEKSEFIGQLEENAKEFYENGLWTARTRITKKQYDNIIREINKKGENGLGQ